MHYKGHLAQKYLYLVLPTTSTIKDTYSIQQGLLMLHTKMPHKCCIYYYTTTRSILNIEAGAL